MVSLGLKVTRGASLLKTVLNYIYVSFFSFTHTGNTNLVWQRLDDHQEMLPGILKYLLIWHHQNHIIARSSKQRYIFKSTCIRSRNCVPRMIGLFTMENLYNAEPGNIGFSTMDNNM